MTEEKDDLLRSVGKNIPALKMSQLFNLQHTPINSLSLATMD